MLSFCLLILMASAVEAHNGIEGYLVSVRPSFPHQMCVGHVSGEAERMFNFTADPSDNENCDIIILEPIEIATFDAGFFTIQAKDSGFYLNKDGDYDFYFTSEPVDLFIVTTGGMTPTALGINDLLNENSPQLIWSTNGEGFSCVYDYANPETDGWIEAYTDTYCENGTWWFQEVQVSSSTETSVSTSMQTSMAPTDDISSGSGDDDDAETTTENGGSLAHGGAAWFTLLALVAACLSIADVV